MKIKNEKTSTQNLEHVAMIYQKGEALNELDYFMCVKEDERLYCQKALKVEIDQILQSMAPELASIIENDFLKPKDKGWWKNLYAPATYRKMKNIAISAFFHCLYT